MPFKAKLFGGFRLFSSCGREIEIGNRRARALLAMLLLDPGEPLARVYICKLLWTGRFEAQARASLRQCLLALSRIFEEFGPTILKAGRTEICIPAGMVSTDLGDLESFLNAGKYDEACAILEEIGAEPLLEQLHFSPEFERWLSIRRGKIEQRMSTSVQDHLLKLTRGKRQAEYANLLSTWSGRSTGNREAARFMDHGGEVSLAVLPFPQFNIGNVTSMLGEGVVDELITSLGQVRGLLVTGRTSSAQYAETTLPLPRIAAELGVSHLVEGCVHFEGENARINVRLIDGQTGFEMWSYRHDGTLTDIFALREQIACAVRADICRTLKVDGPGNASRKMTANRDAYSLYLQGRALTNRAIGENLLDTAIGLLEQAVELDPDFAEGWAALAEAHVNKSVYTPCLDRIAESWKMAELAQIAIDKDPRQGHARAMLAIHQWTLKNPVRALDLAYEAFALEPDNPYVSIRLGSFLLYIGRTKDAAPYIERALRQDPVHGRSYAVLSTLYLNLGDIDRAMAAGKRMTDLGFPSMWHAVAIAASGDRDRAVETYRQTRRLMNSVIFPPVGTEPMTEEAMDIYWTIPAKGCFSGKAQDRAFYCQMLDGLHETMHDPCDPSIILPAIWMGHTDLVLKIYGKCIHPANMIGLMSLWTDIEPIRQIRLSPQFMPFAHAFGLVDAWEKYGWPDLMPASADNAANDRQFMSQG
jgi:TolB-like protein/cytochrome c-type biogenesis protein CcmH/NrfG